MKNRKRLLETEKKMAFQLLIRWKSEKETNLRFVLYGRDIIGRSVGIFTRCTNQIPLHSLTQKYVQTYIHTHTYTNMYKKSFKAFYKAWNRVQSYGKSVFASLPRRQTKVRRRSVVKLTLIQPRKNSSDTRDVKSGQN